MMAMYASIQNINIYCIINVFLVTFEIFYETEVLV